MTGGQGGDWSLPPSLEFLPGELLSDPEWLAGRIEAAGRVWRTPETATRATLWWYSASAVLLGPAVHALASSGRATSLRPEQLRFTLTTSGLPERILPVPGAPVVDGGTTGFGQHLDDTLAQLIEPLAAAGAVPGQRLWAVAADALGGRLVAERCTTLSPDIAAAAPRLRPAPRFVRILAGPAGDHGTAAGDGPAMTYLRRGSCCMIFRVPGQGLCVSCPRQAPQERQQRLERYTRGLLS